VKLLPRTIALAALFSFAATTLAASNNPFLPSGKVDVDNQVGEATKMMDPFEVPLPPYPKPENLVEFNAGPADAKRIYVDTTSISIGTDEVVRYVLVVKGTGGGSNVSYEGMRCWTWDRITYAWGGNDGSWSRSRQSEMTRMPTSSTLRYYRALAEEVFCRKGEIAGAPADMVAALKRGGNRLESR